ncbi:gamma-butyrobetaine hydroxylase-like domain-containing protein [Methylopila henanensis]|uniref:Gamma-butyrobetaine hydroxylase-like domain-containing protein n=1 Tax=Methylopila henanensis TaxID=873516 RepID=A0ABW4K5T9_9HYPH
MADEADWPIEIKLSRDGRTLTVAWADGARHELAAELLRVESPSAEVQGHSPEQKTIVPGKREVAIRDVQEVGSYAVRLVFDDGHSTGIYTWPTLRAFGDEGAELFAAYEAALAERGLSRG